MTAFSLWTLVAGVAAVLLGVVIVALVVVRSARRRRSVSKLPARRPTRRLRPAVAGRVYVSRTAGAQRARDRVVASPVLEAGATTHSVRPARVSTGDAGSHTARAGRHRMAGASR